MAIVKIAIGSILVAAAVVLFLLVSPQKTAPEIILKESLGGDGLIATVSTAILYPQDETRRLADRRGLSELEAKALLASCGQQSAWTIVGDEAPALVDGVPKPFHYSVMACRQGAGTLLARLWMDRDMVDHAPELIGGSYFLACGAGQCPDFAVGDPPLADLPSDARPFKVQHPVTKP